MNLNKIRRITRDGRWIPEIDGLRFVAILSVLLFHMAGELAARSGHRIPVEPRYDLLFTAIGNGDRGVRLFFVISGLILALPFARHYLANGKEVSLRKYYLRRVTRLEPPYILSMILLTLMIGIYSRGHLPAGYGWHALASTFYQHNLIYGTMSTVNSVTWSLEVEIQFYILAPFIMQLFRIPNKNGRRIGLLVATLLLGLLQMPWQNTPRVEMSILFYLQYFLAGLFLADIFILDLEDMRSTWIWDVAGWAGLACMFGLGHDLYAAHVLLPFALMLVFMGAMRSIWLRRFFANAWIAVIGGMCYSIYLMHFALIAVLFKATRHIIVPRLDFLGNYLIQIVVMGVPVLLISAAFYLLIERPCMDPDWPSRLWHRVTGRSGDEAAALDTAGISDDVSTVHR